MSFFWNGCDITQKVTMGLQKHGWYCIRNFPLHTGERLAHDISRIDWVSAMHLGTQASCYEQVAIPLHYVFIILYERCMVGCVLLPLASVMLLLKNFLSETPSVLLHTFTASSHLHCIWISSDPPVVFSSVMFTATSAFLSWWSLTHRWCPSVCCCSEAPLRPQAFKHLLERRVFDVLYKVLK